MQRRRFPLTTMALSASLIVVLTLLSACSGVTGGTGEPTGETPADDDRLRIVTTYSIVADLVRQVAGERAVVTSLVPVGADPHTYEPRPSDLQAVASADAVFYHGLNLELWFDRLIDNVGGQRPTFTVTDGITPLTVEVGSYQGLPDPHAWMDPRLVMQYVANIRDALIKLDPDGTNIYKQRAAGYMEELHGLDRWIREQVAMIPEERRLLVTSENAFRYFAGAYGFEIVGYIFNLAPEDEPSARQITELVDRIRAEQVPAVFAETTLDPKILQRIAGEAGVRLAGNLYVDSLGPIGSDGDTYLKMMRANVTKISEGLREASP